MTPKEIYEEGFQEGYDAGRSLLFPRKELMYDVFEDSWDRSDSKEEKTWRTDEPPKQFKELLLDLGNKKEVATHFNPNYWGEPAWLIYKGDRWCYVTRKDIKRWMEIPE